MGLLSKLFGPPSPEAFANLFMAELLRHGLASTFDPANFYLRAADSQVINLGNFYKEHCLLPKEQRKDHIRKSVTACLVAQQDLPEEFEDAKPDLRIKLWCRATIEKLDLERMIEANKKGVDLPLQSVGEHLYATVVYDFPNSVRSVSSEEVSKWGVTPYEAMEVAKQNLAEDNFAFANIGDRLYAAVTGDSYDASRLLLVDLIRSLKVDGDHVAMVPSRESLFITGSDDDEGISMMLDLAEKAVENPRPILFMPLRLTGDTWMDWMPDKSHPLFSRFQLLEMKHVLPEYEEQKKLLDALHEKQGVDLFVASTIVVQKVDDSLFSYCVWSKGVNTLLPKTQKVVFFEDGKNMVAAGDWDKVVGIVGHLMEETDYYPPRFRVREFPTEEQLAAIGRLE
ncbi:MAG: hypothetical protein K8T91_23625 [Planctomycetes bacterium]|nr:hypothetical protein [Planctomycetota bacterium]